MKKHDTQKIKEALKYAFGGFIAGTVLATGIFLEGNYSKNKRNFEEINETKTMKIYSPLSYIELIKEGNKIRSISQKSLFNDSTILKFDLNHLGRVEKMVENSSLWGNPKLRISYPEKDKTIDWKAVNKTAERYATYLKKEK
jgi:hypothetical protein